MVQTPDKWTAGLPFRKTPFAIAALFVAGLGLEYYNNPEDGVTASVGKFIYDLVTGEGPITNSLYAQLREEGLKISTLSEEAQRAMLGSGGVDVRNADGTWSRWELKFNPDGTVADITKTTKPPLGTGWFITEDPGRQLDVKYSLVPPNQSLETDAARTRDESALPPYNETETEAELRKGGAVPVGESKPSAWDKQVPRLIKQPAEVSHIPLDKPEAYIEEVKRTGGYTDNNGRTWKLWIHPTHGPFWVIDADGDPRVPVLQDAAERDGTKRPQTIREWTPGVESPSGKKS